MICGTQLLMVAACLLGGCIAGIAGRVAPEQAFRGSSVLDEVPLIDG